MKTLYLILIFFLSISLIDFSQIEVRAQDGLIVIRDDGGIEGTEKIQRDQNIYTLTDNIQNSIIINKDNAVLDGAGYALEYLRKNHGITVNGKTVTIKGLIVTQTESNSTYGVGIYVNATTNCIIDNNTITGNNIGIAVSQSPKTRISNNNITNNDFSGISISYPETRIIGNLITENWRGIYIIDYVENTVTRNHIKNNMIGIEYVALSNMDTANKNKIYQNNFINNTYQFRSSAVMWVPLGNIFEKSYTGNFWSDYNGTDIDGDEIGDTPYYVDENNQDNYPLMEPVDIETIPEFPSWIVLPMFVLITIAVIVSKNRLEKHNKSEKQEKTSRIQYSSLFCRL